MNERREELEQKWALGLGGVAGGALGLLVNFLAFQVIDDPSYPVTPTTFVLVVAGAFGGIHLAERLGTRGLRVMSVATGIVVALLVASWLLLASAPDA